MYEYKISNIDDLIPYVNNSREHSDKQIVQLASAMKEFGFTQPVLIDETNGVIAGHGRLLAAKRIGIVDIPSIVIEGLTDAQKKALVIADNKLALNSTWNEEMLKNEILHLNDLDYDLANLGFDIDELTKLVDDIDPLDMEPKEETYSEMFNVIVECSDENEQEKIFNRLDEEGYKCRVQSL